MLSRKRPSPVNPVVKPERFDVLVFEVGGRRFGLPAAAVHEVVRAVALAPLPKAPPIVEGVLILRGTLVPVLDIRGRFRLPPRALTPSDHLIIARSGPRLVALRVDRAHELLPLSRADLQPAHDVVPGAEYVTWLAQAGTEVLLIHDLDTFLSHAEAEELAEALPTDGPAAAER
jgi:purine-binding chemotaxis protein CheW